MSTQGLLSMNDDDDECFAYIKQNVILQKKKVVRLIAQEAG